MAIIQKLIFPSPRTPSSLSYFSDILQQQFFPYIIIHQDLFVTSVDEKCVRPQMELIVLHKPLEQAL